MLPHTSVVGTVRRIECPLDTFSANRMLDLIKVEVSKCFSATFPFIVISRLFQCEIGTSPGWDCSKKMHRHLELCQRLIGVTTGPPQESQKVHILFGNPYLMEHFFSVPYHCCWFVSNSEEYTQQGVRNIRTLQQLLVQRSAFKQRGTVKDHPDCLFSFVVDTVVRNIPQSSIILEELFFWHSFCMSFHQDIIHEADVIFPKCFIFLESSDKT